MDKSKVILKRGVWKEGYPARNDSPTPIEYAIYTPEDPHIRQVVLLQITPRTCRDKSVYFEINSEFFLIPDPPTSVTTMEEAKEYAVKCYEDFVRTHLIEGIEECQN